jgi:peptidyl-prolyl cis-trans isomerase A (cyclophilin A)
LTLTSFEDPTGKRFGDGKTKINNADLEIQMRVLENTIVDLEAKLKQADDANIQPPPPQQNPSVANPSALNEQAPATYKVRFDTTRGPFVVEVTRAWAPRGADRFYNLVKNGFYDNVRFFRVISGFMVQFGINGDPAIMASWRTAQIPDDPVTQSNTRGTITFATAGPNTRTSQVFINFGDNARLGQHGFAPFGKVVSGMNVVDSLNAEYGEAAPRGRGPDQSRLQNEGNDYLMREYPRLDYIKKATIER